MCGGEKVGEKDIDYQVVKFAEYQQILLAAQNEGLIPGISPGNYSDYPPCKKVKYCPVTMKIHSTWSDVLGIDGTLTYVGDGCYDLNCGLFGWFNSDFCLTEILPNNEWNWLEIFPDYEGCQIAIVNFYQLMIWADQIAQEFPTTFPNNELDLLIQEYIGDPRAKCAYITFCMNDFKVLNPPGFMDLIHCNDY